MVSCEASLRQCYLVPRQFRVGITLLEPSSTLPTSPFRDNLRIADQPVTRLLGWTSETNRSKTLSCSSVTRTIIGAMVTAKSSHDTVLAGESLLFIGSEPEVARTVSSEWIAEAVRKSLSVHIENAIIIEPLSLTYATITEEFLIIACEINQAVDLSYTTFKRNALMNGTIFRAGVSFQGATFECDAMFDDCKLEGGDVNFAGVHVFGMFLANRASFGEAAGTWFHHAVFDKSGLFNEAIFKGGVSFADSHFLGGAEFVSTRFENDTVALFERVKIDGFARFDQCRFEGTAIFFCAQLGSDATFTQTQFVNPLLETTFYQAEISGSAVFHGAVFHGPLLFYSSHIGRDACFQGAVFKGPASFNGTRIGGVALFHSEQNLPSAVFEDAAEFINLDAASDVYLGGVKFRNGNKWADFGSSRIGGSFFASNVVFESGARFAKMKVNGDAFFQGAIFRKKANFNGAEVNGFAFFRALPEEQVPATCFEGEADFKYFRVGLNAEYSSGTKSTLPIQEPSGSGCVFKGPTSFSFARIEARGIFRDAQFLRGSMPKFVGTHFGQDAFFEGATFDDEVNFRAAEISGEGRFDGTLFKASASFREASCRVLYFCKSGLVRSEGKEQLQFQQGVDLRGCNYKRIEADWLSLVRQFQPYDRQPYLQIERVYRDAGQDEEADRIYLARKKREHYNKTGVSKLLDWLYWRGVNYGVRPLRLLLFALITLAWGTVVFYAPRAGQSKATSSPVGGNPMVQGNRSVCMNKWGLGQATRFSIRAFLPIDLPLERECEVSDERRIGLRFSDWASFLRLLGWLVVPIGASAFTGLLRRVTP